MLAEAVKDFREKRSSEVKKCVVQTWGENLPAEDTKAFEDVLVDYSISNRQLLVLLRNAGAEYSLEALRKHRNRECPCR